MNKIKWILRLIRNKQLSKWRKIQVLLGIGNKNYEIKQNGTGQFIYALFDPVYCPPKLFYIGRSNNPGRRYFEHFNKFDGTDKAKRIRRLKRQFHMPYMTILEQCSPNNVKERERYWIAKFGGKSRLENMKE